MIELAQQTVLAPIKERLYVYVHIVSWSHWQNKHSDHTDLSNLVFRDFSRHRKAKFHSKVFPDTNTVLQRKRPFSGGMFSSLTKSADKICEWTDVNNRITLT